MASEDMPPIPDGMIGASTPATKDQFIRCPTHGIVGLLVNITIPTLFDGTEHYCALCLRDLLIDHGVHPRPLVKVVQKEGP